MTPSEQQAQSSSGKRGSGAVAGGGGAKLSSRARKRLKQQQQGGSAEAGGATAEEAEPGYAAGGVGDGDCSVQIAAQSKKHARKKELKRKLKEKRKLSDAGAARVDLRPREKPAPPAPPVAIAAGAGAGAGVGPPPAQARPVWKKPLPVGRDPPVHLQLRPLSKAQLLTRIAREPRRNAVKHVPGVRDRLVALYEESPRRELPMKGSPVPGPMCEGLLRELEGLQWPETSHRPGLSSQHYLVLTNYALLDQCAGRPARAESSKEQQPPQYRGLYGLAERLMLWAAPEDAFSAIAVTKNFVGSPHIDEKDVGYQHAVSLGSFNSDTGGQLCVDCEDQRAVAVVDTRNRIARVDGRYVHWVRGFGGGDRYSLIFYVTVGKGTARERAVHTDFDPAAAAAAAAVAS